MEKIDATVIGRHKEATDVYVIDFILTGGGTLPYCAGQYITVYKHGSNTPQGKAYSLSSAPHEPVMSITVKKVGEFSGYLSSLKKGDHLTISKAYGYFNPVTTKPLVALAAGVGISPILGVYKDEFNKNANREAHLFYTNKSPAHIAHRQAISKTNAKANYHVTAVKSAPSGMKLGRIVLDECLTAAEDAAYLICGGVEFVKDMWQGLTQRGVAAQNITTEIFFES